MDYLKSMGKYLQEYTYLNEGAVNQLCSIIQPYNIVINIPSYLNDAAKRIKIRHKKLRVTKYQKILEGKFKEFSKTVVVNFERRNLQESVRAVRGQTVRAKTDATVQAIDVLFVLLGLFVNYACVIEFLCEKDLKPTRKKMGGSNKLKNSEA